MSGRAIFVASAFATGVAIAAPFNDPTRPPTASEAAGVPSGTEAGPRVESILIAPDRRVAIINGESVALGGKTAAGQVVRITESEVVIRGAEGEQTLKLFPGLAGRAPLLQERTPE